MKNSDFYRWFLIGIISLFGYFIAVISFFPVQASSDLQSSPVEIVIFSSPTCPHCRAAKEFLYQLASENSKLVNVTDYTFSQYPELLQKYYERYQVPQEKRGLVPALFYGDQYSIGFSEPIAEEMRTYVLTSTIPTRDKTTPKLDIPFPGLIDLFSWSLPAFALVLGLADGFNVCSLGALVMILGMVLAFRSRMKMLTIGGIFILTTGLIYGMLIFLWHRIFGYLSGVIPYMERFIGTISFVAGIYLLYLFWQSYKKGPVCSSNNLMTQLAPKIQSLFKSKASLLSLIVGIIFFAAIVTIIEFPCSAVLPVLFAGILAESGASTLATFISILIYMLAYLIDEVLIFVLAVVTLKINIVSPRWIVFFNLLTACVFIALGIGYLWGVN